MKKTIITIIFLLSFTVQSFGWSKNVLISPLRVLIDKNHKSASVHIINPSDTDTTYRIYLVSMNVDENGKQTEVSDTEGGNKKSSDILRFSPKRVKLAPGQSQTIRLLARKSLMDQHGEYRTHLKVSPLPPEENPEQNSQESKNMNVQINFLVSTTIPVIVRHGSTYASVKINRAQLINNQIHLDLERTGTQSALFDVEITDQNGKIIGTRNNNAFYTPNKKLILSVNLNDEYISAEKILIKLKNAEKTEDFIYDVYSIKR